MMHWFGKKNHLVHVHVHVYGNGTIWIGLILFFFYLELALELTYKPKVMKACSITLRHIFGNLCQAKNRTIGQAPPTAVLLQVQGMH